MARPGRWEQLKHHTSQDITAALAGISLAPGAAEGIATLRAAGVRTFIVSLALAQCAAYFARRLRRRSHRY